MDIESHDDVIEQCVQTEPDIIINCAANSLPDLAEDKKEWTYHYWFQRIKSFISW